MQLGALDQAFRHWLTPQGAWAQQVTLAQIEAGTVTLTATSAAVATRLRFSEDAIADWFAGQTGQAITSLKV
ncbi:DciA family protein, partial [Acinetobacter baumannii]